jgi:hypothetical protein
VNDSARDEDDGAEPGERGMSSHGHLISAFENEEDLFLRPVK